MIFPFLHGLLSPQRIPITYLLIALNLFVFCFTYERYLKSDATLSSLLRDEEYLTTQGSIFAQMIHKREANYSSTLIRLADSVEHEVGEPSNERAVLLGYVAIRNPYFLVEASTFKTIGDEIALGFWKEKFEKVVRAQEDHPLYGLGLNYKHQRWTNYITYQFSHSGAIHLLWNMLFLLIFGGMIELRLGLHWLVSSYLVGGVMGGLTYAAISGISGSPLVGASGSVCAIMGLVVVAFFHERILYWYWFLPIPGYFGFVRLPGWIIFILFAVPDIAGVVSSVEEIGFAVAHTAHLGGTISGLALGACWLLFGPGHGNFEEHETLFDPPQGTAP